MRIRPDRLKPILRVEFVFIACVISALLFTTHSLSQAPLYDVVQIDAASAVREEVVRQLDICNSVARATIEQKGIQLSSFLSLNLAQLGSMISEGRGEFDAFEVFSSHPNKFI